MKTDEIVRTAGAPCRGQGRRRLRRLKDIEPTACSGCRDLWHHGCSQRIRLSPATHSLDQLATHTIGVRRHKRLHFPPSKIQPTGSVHRRRAQRGPVLASWPAIPHTPNKKAASRAHTSWTHKATFGNFTPLPRSRSYCAMQLFDMDRQATPVPFA